MECYKIFSPINKLSFSLFKILFSLNKFFAYQNRIREQQSSRNAEKLENQTMENCFLQVFKTRASLQIISLPIHARESSSLEL